MNLFKHMDNDYNYILSMAGDDILINDSTQVKKAVINNLPVNSQSDLRTISSTEELNGGDYITWDSGKWLIISEIGHKRFNYYKGIMQKCHNTLTVNVAGNLYRVPYVVTNKVNLNIDVTYYLTVLENEIYILVANNTINSNIQLNDIYKIGRYNYKVISMDDISRPGLLLMKMKYSEEGQVLPNYSITILNGNTLTTDTATPVQLNVEQKDGETVLADPLPMVFTSSDISIATVDSTGMVTPVSVGNATITVSLESDATVNDSIVITVEEVEVPEVYTLELIGDTSPDTEIKQNQTKTYTAVKKNSLGNIVEGAVFDFSIDPETTPTDKYTLTVLDDTQCTIKANGATYYINLIATDRTDGNLTVSKRIKLKPLF